MWFQNIFRPRAVQGGINFEEHAGWRDLKLSPVCLRQLQGMQLTASRYLKGHAAGMRYSLRRKPALEFREHRMYVPGDDVRHVDWKASARSQHIFIKQGEHPKEAKVYILIDCSRSMAWGQAPKFRTALSLAAALGLLALSNHDRLMVVPLGSPELQPLGFISGKGQYPLFLNYLRSLSFNGVGDLYGAIQQFVHRTSRGGGLAFLLSDLLGMHHLPDTLRLLPVPTWDVTVLQILHPEELQPTLRGDFEFVDVENGNRVNYDITKEAIEVYCRRLKDWLSQIEQECIDSNTFYGLVQTSWSLEQEIIPRLRELNVIGAV